MLALALLLAYCLIAVSALPSELAGRWGFGRGAGSGIHRRDEYDLVVPLTAMYSAPNVVNGYSLPVGFGDQSGFNVHLDTGSGDIWVNSDLITEDLIPEEERDSRLLYHAREKVRQAGERCEIQSLEYVSDEVTVWWLTDTLKIGSDQIEDMEFGAVLKTTRFDDFADGLFGVSPSAARSMQEKRGESSRQFALIKDGESQSPVNALAFGTFDDENIAWADVDEDHGGWLLKSDQTDLERVHVDTGYTFISLSNARVLKYLSPLIPGVEWLYYSDLVWIKCALKPKLDPLELSLDGHPFKFKGEFLVGFTDERGPENGDDKWCVSLLQELTPTEGDWDEWDSVLGITFIQHVQTVFDFGEKPRIGFVKQPEAPQATQV